MKRWMIPACATFFALAGCGVPDMVEDATFSAALSDGMGELLADAADPAFDALEVEAREDVEADLDEGASYAFDCSLDGLRALVVERYDENENGRLDREERADLRMDFDQRPHRRHRFARHHRLKRLRWIYDADESGHLGADERAELRNDLELRCFNRQARLLERYDEDEDGELSADELAQARHDLHARIAARRQAILDEFDLDEDGVLDRDERAAAAEARRERIAERRREIFDAFDEDDSGDLDETEYAALREALKSRVRGEHFVGDEDA